MNAADGKRKKRDDDLRILHQTIWPHVIPTEGYFGRDGSVALNLLREKARDARDERDALEEIIEEIWHSNHSEIHEDYYITAAHEMVMKRRGRLASANPTEDA